MKRPLLIAAAVLTVLVLLAGVAFVFGTPQAPEAASAASGSAGADAAATAPASGTPAGASAAQPTSAEEVPEADPSVPLAIEIPGCVCHSDDPAQVEAHAKYRMNQCAGCHGGQTPTGQ